MLPDDGAAIVGELRIDSAQWRRAASVWVGAIAVAYIAGSVATGIAVIAFGGGVLLPLYLLVAHWLQRAAHPIPARECVGLIGAIAALAPLYVLRNALALPSLCDLVIPAALWTLVAATGILSCWRERLAARWSNEEVFWTYAVLPMTFALTWLGYEVHEGDHVKYLGLFFVDFGNLLSIVNTVKASPGLPLSPVVGSGPLGYHWFFFALPAWASEFAGCRATTANVLTLANLLAAMLLYRALLYSGRRALLALTGSALHATRAAGLALFLESSLYAYQFLSRRTGIPWLAPGERNHLVLQIPHSMTCFGNNTLGVTACLLSLSCLAAWDALGGRAALTCAALLVALLPGYSITLVIPMVITIMIGIVIFRVRRPVVTVATFAGAGLFFLLLYRLTGLFTYGSGNGGFEVEWDHGQFLRVVLLGLLPVSLAFAVTRRHWANESVRWLCLLVGVCILVPTVLKTRGTPTSSIDMSLKVGTLLLAAAAPLFGLALVRLGSLARGRLAARAAALLVLAAAATNSLTYVLQHAWARVSGNTTRAHVLDRDHFDALALVAPLPPRLVLLDALSEPFVVSDPAVMLGGKRVLVPSGYEHVAFPMSPLVKQHQATWREWADGHYQDEARARELASVVDILILNGPIRSASWRKSHEVGAVSIYRSTSR